MAILERDGYRCVYCGRTSQETPLEIDHVEAKARGGSDQSTNLVTACRDCNAGKSDEPRRLPEGYRPEPIGLQQRRRPRPYTVAGDPPPTLAYASDACFAPNCRDHLDEGCATTLPSALVDGDARSVQLSYRCACGHQWHCWWDPGYARLHADTVRYEVRSQGLPTFPPSLRWLS